MLKAPGASLPARPSCLHAILRCQLHGAGPQVRTLLHLPPLAALPSCSITHPPSHAVFAHPYPALGPLRLQVTTLPTALSGHAQSLNCPSCNPPPTTSRDWLPVAFAVAHQFCFRPLSPLPLLLRLQLAQPPIHPPCSAVPSLPPSLYARPATFAHIPACFRLHSSPCLCLRCFRPSPCFVGGSSLPQGAGL